MSIQDLAANPEFAEPYEGTLVLIILFTSEKNNLYIVGYKTQGVFSLVPPYKFQMPDNNVNRIDKV